MRRSDLDRLQWLSDRWNRRSVGMPGRAVFERIRQERLQAVRRNAWQLGTVTVSTWGLGLVTVWVLVATGHRYQAAFFAGVFVTMWVALIAHFFTVLGTVTRRMGGSAEQWTAKAIRRLDRKKYVAVHHLMAGGVDIDHVVLSGEHVIAVETKWTTKKLRAMPNGHLAGMNQSWTRQAATGARWVDRALRAHGADLPVTAALILWGPGVPQTPAGRFHTGRIHVLIGEQAQLWSVDLRGLLGETPARERDVEALLAASEAM